MRWRRRSEQTTKPCPAPGCTVPYEECYMHRADEAVWDFVVAHGEEVRAARRAADAQPKASSDE